jgi:transcriptional regulator with XRE-family HTH domain
MAFAGEPWAVALQDDFRTWILLMLDSDAYRTDQSALARALGFTQGWVNKLKSGERHGEIDFPTLERLASAFQLDAWRVLWAIQNQQLLPPPSPTAFDPARRGRRPKKARSPETRA